MRSLFVNVIQTKIVNFNMPVICFLFFFFPNVVLVPLPALFFNLGRNCKEKQ